MRWFRVVGVGGGDEGGGLALPRWQMPQLTCWPAGGVVSWVRKRWLISALMRIMTRARSFMGLASEAKSRWPVVGLVGGVLGVAVVTVDAELVFEVMHDVDDLVAGEVLGEDLQVGGLGAGAAGVRLLRGGGGGCGVRGLGVGGGGECERARVRRAAIEARWERRRLWDILWVPLMERMGAASGTLIWS